MAKLSSYRSIYKADYAEQFQDLVDKMSLTINASFTEIYNALNNNLTFQENFNATITTVKGSVDKNGVPQTSISFKLREGQKTVQGIIPLNIICTNSSITYPNGGIFLSFTNNNGVVTINNIQGLSANNTFQITILAI